MVLPRRAANLQPLAGLASDQLLHSKYSSGVSGFDPGHTVLLTIDFLSRREDSQMSNFATCCALSCCVANCWPQKAAKWRKEECSTASVSPRDNRLKTSLCLFAFFLRPSTLSCTRWAAGEARPGKLTVEAVVLVASVLADVLHLTIRGVATVPSLPTHLRSLCSLLRGSRPKPPH